MADIKVNNCQRVRGYRVDNNIDGDTIREYNHVLACAGIFNEVSEYHLMRHLKKLMINSARQKQISPLVKFEYLSLKDLNLMKRVYNYLVVFAEGLQYAEPCFFRTLSMA